MIFGRLSGALLLFLAAALPLLGVGVPHLSISEIVSSADVIVIANVSLTRPLRTATLVRLETQVLPAHNYAADLRVRSVIKGSCPGQLTVTYALPDSFMGYLPLHSGLRMVFLRQTGDGYELANQYYPDLPASDETVPPDDLRTTDQLVEVVLRQLANVIASRTASRVDKFRILDLEYVIPAGAYFNAALKKGIANAATQQIREALQAELLARGDLSELSNVAEALLMNHVSREQKIALLYAIGAKLKDRRAVPALVPLLSSDAPTRAAASEALWHIADPSTAKILVRSLEDPDHQVRYYAVRALADITGQQQWGPSIPEFDEREDLYLSHWKEWARGH